MHPLTPQLSNLLCAQEKWSRTQDCAGFPRTQRQNQTDKYSTKEILECLADIGKANSSIFTPIINLTSGFWQMDIHPEDSPLTAVTVKNKGQFE